VTSNVTVNVPTSLNVTLPGSSREDAGDTPSKSQAKVSGKFPSRSVPVAINVIAVPWVIVASPDGASISPFGGTLPNSCKAATASIRPAPNVKSGPSGPRSTALAVRASPISTAVAEGAASRSKAATPATCGAAAEVPKKRVGKPPTPLTCTPSTDVTSGFDRVSRVG